MAKVPRVVLVLSAILCVAIGVLWVALPGATDPAGGAPDPIVGLRRPLVKGLRSIGILPRPNLFVPDPYLPSGIGRSFGDPATAEGDEEWTRHRLEPVYRGLLWHIGMRVTVRHRADAGTKAVQVRYQIGDASVVAARSEEGQPTGSRTSRVLRVVAYVPDGWTSWVIEAVAADGTARTLHSWTRANVDW